MRVREAGGCERSGGGGLGWVREREDRRRGGGRAREGGVRRRGGGESAWGAGVRGIEWLGQS